MSDKWRIRRELRACNNFLRSILSEDSFRPGMIAELINGFPSPSVIEHIELCREHVTKGMLKIMWGSSSIQEILGDTLEAKLFAEYIGICIVNNSLGRVVDCHHGVLHSPENYIRTFAEASTWHVSEVEHLKEIGLIAPKHGVALERRLDKASSRDSDVKFDSLSAELNINEPLGLRIWSRFEGRNFQLELLKSSLLMIKLIHGLVEKNHQISSKNKKKVTINLHNFFCYLTGAPLVSATSVVDDYFFNRDHCFYKNIESVELLPDRDIWLKTLRKKRPQLKTFMKNGLFDLRLDGSHEETLQINIYSAYQILLARLLRTNTGMFRLKPLVDEILKAPHEQRPKLFDSELNPEQKAS